MRAAELLNMQWNWIDFNKNLITIKCTSTFSTKSKKERVISISPVLRNQNIKLNN